MLSNVGPKMLSNVVNGETSESLKLSVKPPLDSGFGYELNVLTNCYHN